MKNCWQRTHTPHLLSEASTIRIVCAYACITSAAHIDVRRLTDDERAGDRVVLLFAETAGKAGRVPLAPSLLLQYWLAVSMQPGSYHLQVLVLP